MRSSVHRTSHDLLRELLRDGLAAAAESSHGNRGHESVCYRACAALYALLGDHPIDRRGRCRCCRSPRALIARRRFCRVYLVARYYLHQPHDVLLHNLACELEPSRFPHRGGDDASSRRRGAGDPDATEVLPRISSGSADSHEHPMRTSSALCPYSACGVGLAERTSQARGGAGDEVPDASGFAALHPKVPRGGEGGWLSVVAHG